MTKITNEEKKLQVYSIDKKPTTPKTVKFDTPLENLNLNWGEKDLPERIRTKHVHRLHPYLGKYIPQLVEIFLRKYFKPGQTVLDPFCGSGTTLVQANELGINSIGYDISAFNVLLSRAKTSKYDTNKVNKEVIDILNKVQNITQKNAKQLSLFEFDFNTTNTPREIDNQYLKEWFAPQALYELITYRDLIESEGYEYKDLLKIILSRSARSARLTTHYDLDFPKKPQNEPYHCYKHSRICKPVQEAFKFINRYSHDTIKRIEEFQKIRTEATVIIEHTDSRETKIPKIHGVVTSPPYVGLIDYHQQHIYAYHLLGLEDRKQIEIGPAANGTSQKAKRKYQEDIATVFSRIAKSMINGGKIIVVANDKSNLYPDIANMIGLKTEAVVQRHVNRRTGRRSGAFFESVFIWKKN
jgi:DNA modification methylase